MSAKKNELKKHCHAHMCAHRRVKYCGDCGKVYCAECKQEWLAASNPYHISWGTSYPSIPINTGNTFTVHTPTDSPVSCETH